MSLSTEAIVAIIALFVAVAQLFYTIWKYISKEEPSIEPGEKIPYGYENVFTDFFYSSIDRGPAFVYNRRLPAYRAVA
jgi:hypothetical protein